MAEVPPSPGSSSIAGHTSVMFRNIIVGVATTILGSTAVYFLGFHKKGEAGSKASYLEMKEATTKAWRSYVAIENIYYKNLFSINKDQALASDLDQYKAEMSREKARFRKDLEQIIKDADIDKALISMLERRLEREKETDEALNRYIDNLTAFNAYDNPDKKQEQVLKETQSYYNKASGILERTLNELEDLSRTLSERYGQPFNVHEIQAYLDFKNGQLNTNPANPRNPGNQGANNATQVDPNMFPGKWSTTGANIDLNADGTFNWDVLSTGDKSSGTWEVKDNRLHMYPSAGNSTLSTWTFNLMVNNPNLFTMTLSIEPFNSYTMARIKE